MPGIWSDGQAEVWAEVVAAVKRDDGRIVLQTWRVGRIPHPERPES